MANQDKGQKAELIFDRALDYMGERLKEEEIPAGELKAILEFLDRQGINCVGSKNSKVKSMVSRLPVSVASNQ